MPLLLILALQGVPEPGMFDLAKPSKVLDRTRISRCDDPAPSDDILVCGQRRDPYRLPLPVESALSSDHVRGEPSSTMAAITPSGPCGIFAGQRRCSKREAAQYGYGNGRDPVTVLTRLAKKIGDPDAD